MVGRRLLGLWVRQLVGLGNLSPIFLIVLAALAAIVLMVDIVHIVDTTSQDIVDIIRQEEEHLVASLVMIEDSVAQIIKSRAVGMGLRAPLSTSDQVRAQCNQTTVQVATLSVGEIVMAVLHIVPIVDHQTQAEIVLHLQTQRLQ